MKGTGLRVKHIDLDVKHKRIQTEEEEINEFALEFWKPTDLHSN